MKRKKGPKSRKKKKKVVTPIKRYNLPTMTNWWRMIPSHIVLDIIDFSESPLPFSSTSKDILDFMEKNYWKQIVFDDFLITNLGDREDIPWKTLFGQINQKYYKFPKKIFSLHVGDPITNCPACPYPNNNKKKIDKKQPLLLSEQGQANCDKCGLTLGEELEVGLCENCNDDGLLLPYTCEVDYQHQGPICNNCMSVCEKCDIKGCSRCLKECDNCNKYPGISPLCCTDCLPFPCVGESCFGYFCSKNCAKHHECQ